jgi:hypothetical protein
MVPAQPADIFFAAGEGATTLIPDRAHTLASGDLFVNLKR